MPYITRSLFFPFLPYASFTMERKGGEGCRFAFSKMCHCFIGAASLHPHHKVDDASALVCSIVVPQVLPKVHFQAGVGVFSVGCVIEGITIVTLRRLDTIGVQVVGYRYRLDVL